MAAGRANRALPRAAVAVVALALSGAGAVAETLHVAIKDLTFGPTAITARVGDVIEWTNTDFIAHTATAENGDFDVEIEPGATARVTVSKAGVVRYYCVFHPDMKASVTVLAE